MLPYFLMTWLLAAPALAADPVQLQIEKADGADVLRLENYRVSLLISPARGGAVTSYSDKLAPAELILQKPFNGLCMDHFQEQSWPGEFLETPYEYAVVKQTPEEVQVRVRHTASGRWPMQNQQINPQLSGVQLEKTYTLRADSPALICHVKLTTPAAETKTFAYWLQNVFFAGGDYDRAADRTFRPSARGVRSNAGEGNGHYGNEEWLRDFSAGWQALVDTRQGTGLALLARYDDIKVLYACLGNATQEVMFHPTYVPAGQSREYTVRIVPLIGMKQVTHVGSEVVVAAEVRTDNQGAGQIEFRVARAAGMPRDVKLDVRLFGASDQREVPVGRLSFAAVTDRPQTATLAFTNAPPDPLVIRVTATGRDSAGQEFSEEFEDFFAGAYSWGDNITTDMRTPVYAMERRPQELNLAKPATLKIQAEWGGRYLFFYGAEDDRYQIAKSIHTLGWHSKTEVSHYSYGGQWLGSLSDFPYDYDRLLGYHAIILGGVSRSGLRSIGVEMLHDYLMAGGGLVVLGSYGGYGRSQLKGTKLAEAFPVEWPEGLASLQQVGSRPVRFGPDAAPFRDGIKLSGAARCYFLHAAAAKPDARIFMESGGEPFLVAGEYGSNRARIVCLLGAPLGDPAPGEIPFWEEPNWYTLLRNAIWWAGKQDEPFGTE